MPKGGTHGGKEDLVDVKSLKAVLERKHPAWSKRVTEGKGTFPVWQAGSGDSTGRLKMSLKDT